jgi:hypothetical protein
MKRFLDCNSSDFEKMTGKELLEAIRKSEGRILACETIGVAMPMLGDVTNAEFVAAMGADIIILNLFDVKEPVILGMPKVEPKDTIKEIKRLTGRPIGINLEPVEQSFSNKEEDSPLWKMTEGRKATYENVKVAYEMGVDLIILTGNPGSGVSNKAITESIKMIRENLGDNIVIISGKMHGSGILAESGEKIITKDDIRNFVDAGIDIVLMPAPGTVPGITMEYIRELVLYAHSLGVLTLTTIGTSQEGADTATIKEIALMCKMTGTDIHHLGDTGYFGMALPENILAYGTAIRGVRHTYHRMAISIKR